MYKVMHTKKPEVSGLYKFRDGVTVTLLVKPHACDQSNKDQRNNVSNWVPESCIHVCTTHVLMCMVN